MSCKSFIARSPERAREGGELGPVRPLPVAVLEGLGGALGGLFCRSVGPWRLPGRVAGRSGFLSGVVFVYQGLPDIP